jgi:hypothetical protein
LVHLRLVVPAQLAHPVRELLVGDPRITNVTNLVGAGIDPAGDLMGADAARESADEVLGALRRLGLGRDGSISVTVPQATPFDAADRIEELADGEPDDSVMWDVVLAQASDAAKPSRSFHLFLTWPRPSPRSPCSPTRRFSWWGPWWSGRTSVRSVRCVRGWSVGAGLSRCGRLRSLPVATSRRSLSSRSWPCSGGPPGSSPPIRSPGRAP